MFVYPGWLDGTLGQSHQAIDCDNESETNDFQRIVGFRERNLCDKVQALFRYIKDKNFKYFEDFDTWDVKDKVTFKSISFYVPFYVPIFKDWNPF